MVSLKTTAHVPRYSMLSALNCPFSVHIYSMLIYRKNQAFLGGKEQVWAENHLVSEGNVSNMDVLEQKSASGCHYCVYFINVLICENDHKIGGQI